MGVNQSFAWWSFASSGGVEPEALVRGAAEIGYHGIEMPPRELWGLIRDAGLEIVDTQGHPLQAEGLNRREHLAAIERALRDTLELARSWNIPSLICFSGNRMGLSDEEGLENTVANLQALAPLAEDAGVTLLLEMLNSNVDHPDYQADSTAWAAEVCRQVDSPRVRLLYDVYHMQVMEGDLIRTIGNNHQCIAHYHTAGNPGRRDLDEAQEIYYPAVFRAIRDTGFDGTIGHEFIPKGDPLEALAAAFRLT
ncbi:MAG: TIM barrel protein, partial [Trueperaceae bacterium]